MSITFIDIPAYESLELSIVDGASDGEWVVTGGSYQVTNSGSFQNLLSPNGYQFIPGGLILQWGIQTGFSFEETRVVPFQIEFPNAVLNLSATIKSNSGGLGTHNMYANLNGSSRTNFLMTQDSDDNVSGRDGWWQAIGH